jgi:hypothetical protein
MKPEKDYNIITRSRILQMITIITIIKDFFTIECHII